MRFIITKKGHNILKELAFNSQDNNNVSKEKNISFYSKQPINNDTLFLKYKSKNNEFINNILKYKEVSNKRRVSSLIEKNFLDSFNTNDDIKQEYFNNSKVIKLSKSKINMRKEFFEKYLNMNLKQI